MTGSDLPKSFFMKKPKPLFTILLFSLSLLFIRCSSDKTGLVPSTADVLIRNIWTVDYYYNSQDMTDEFSSGKLIFSSTGVVGYQINGETISGKWSRTLDAANDELIDLQFNSSIGGASMLNESWKLTGRSGNSLQFEGISGTDALFRIKAQ